ncbi:prolyl oligopeptidase family serine peptidase [bacterium]|nr:prolyl oligopeptidase family serine peptidase [bacterium]
MKRYEFTYPSANGPRAAPKPLTALVIEPDRIGPETGAMLFTHGWGPNRFQHEDKMQITADAFDLVCVAVEYRQSGYDFDPVGGSGWDLPYDASFYQVFDVLNGLRAVLARRPELNRQRLLHYGGSQGGHLALLGAVFAPETFAGVYASVAVTHIEPAFAEWAGRSFDPHELAIRDALGMADRIQCPVFVEYGTADPNVNCERHSRALVGRLRASGQFAGEAAYEGGGHDLCPTITRLESYQANAPALLRQWRHQETDDWQAGRDVEIPAADRVLRIDWSKPPDDPALFGWREP